MASKYDGTQTLKNLKYAFSVESEARNKYTFFAAKAKESGYEQLAEIYLKTADNEKEHAELWYKELNDLDDDFLYEILHSCLYHPQDDYYTAYVDGLEYEIWVE